MTSSTFVRRLTLAAWTAGAMTLALLGCESDRHRQAPQATAPVAQIVSMRRLTEAQYRNSIADIFGPDIKVGGRFEPIIRPSQHLLATGAHAAAVSPVGFEQFDAVARSVAAQVFDEAHRPIFVPCAPRDAAAPDDACAVKTLTVIGRYVLRRPLTKQEQHDYAALADDAATKVGSFYSGLELSLAAMLVSPKFLFVTETAEPDSSQPGAMRLDSYSRASHLSFLLWDTTPNDQLLAVADDGELADPAKLDAIASKMAASPRLEDGVRAFFADMLDFEKFEADDYAKDPVIYPRFNADVAAALPEQLLRTIVDDLVVRNNDYRDLFTTRHTFMTRSLGPLYDVPVRAAKGWEPYDFPAGSTRRGLMSQAAFLALYSHPGRSSATQRGRAVRELLLCQPVPDPPGNVDFKLVVDTTNKSLPTARDRLAAHMANPVCAGCHRVTDPIGLTMENFDGIGAYRTTENDAPIDAASTFNGKAVDGESGLSEALASDPATTQCVARRAIEYATGQPPHKDSDTLTSVNQSFADSGYRIRALFQRVATMPASMQRSPPQTAMLNTR
jgi:uncharacterized protein DUF1588/uncharacterized protein DUF1592/uncharacterized protein DUF1595/uncharacterized protein DUF1585/uncharacterized protein DUF1587